MYSTHWLQYMYIYIYTIYILHFLFEFQTPHSLNSGRGLWGNIFFGEVSATFGRGTDFSQSVGHSWTRFEIWRNLSRLLFGTSCFPMCSWTNRLIVTWFKTIPMFSGKPTMGGWCFTLWEGEPHLARVATTKSKVLLAFQQLRYIISPFIPPPYSFDSHDIAYVCQLMQSKYILMPSCLLYLCWGLHYTHMHSLPLIVKSLRSLLLTIIWCYMSLKFILYPDNTTCIYVYNIYSLYYKLCYTIISHKLAPNEIYTMKSY